MKAHRFETLVSVDGSVTVKGLPFVEGQAVEVIVRLRQHGQEVVPTPDILRGSVCTYDHPLEPAIRADEWDSA